MISQYLRVSSDLVRYLQDIGQGVFAVSSLADTMKSLGPARLGIMASIIVGLLLFFVFVTTRVSQPSMSILYSNLTTVDSSAVAGKLEEAKIAYRVSPDGASVFVPETEVGRSRMLLAEAGLPNGGSMGYEIFDQAQGFGQTQFVQNINQVRALQGELARTISSMDPVQFAKVHLVLPQRQLFERQAAEASGSVTLKLKPGMRLNQQQIYAIQNLVANAVPGLKPDRISILDSDANLLAGGTGDEAFGVGGKSDEMRRAYEQRLDGAIEEMVGRVVGLNHVRVQVTADLNFDRVNRSREIYDPEGQVIRSTQTTADKSSETEAGSGATSTTATQNLPGLPTDTSGNGQSGSNSDRTQEVTNYEINKTIENVESESGEVKKLSVAVLVDGTYTTDDKGVKTYKPRDAQELEQITALVKSAVGYDEKRGDSVEVVNLPFADVEGDFVEEKADQIFGFDKKDILDMAEMLTLSVMVVLVLLLVVRPMLTKILAAIPTPNAGGASPYGADGAMYLPGAPGRPALAGPDGMPMLTDESGGAYAAGGGGGNAFARQGGQSEESLIDMSQVEGRVKSSSIKKVSEIVTNHPTETVSVIRNWMNSE